MGYFKLEKDAFMVRLKKGPTIDDECKYLNDDGTSRKDISALKFARENGGTV